MIKYKKTVVLDRRRNGEWQIQTDVGDHYRTTMYQEYNQWWDKQRQTEFKKWQRDICLWETANIVGQCEMFDIYKHGQGWNQDIDICLVHSPEYHLWVLSTTDDFWICESDGTNIQFNRSDSMGSINNPENRKLIYSVYDHLKKEFNPNMELRWRSY